MQSVAWTDAFASAIRLVVQAISEAIGETQEQKPTIDAGPRALVRDQLRDYALEP